MPRCRANKGDGTPCERIVGASHGYCYSHDATRATERTRNAARGGRGRGNSELRGLKTQLQGLADDVLEGTVERGDAAVVNQIWKTIVRVVEQERKERELVDIEERIAALEGTAKGDRWQA